MDSVDSVNELIRRASLVSQEISNTRTSLEQKKIAELDNKPPPKDTYYLVHFLFFLIGLLQWLPATFFVTANDYWMHKFRDTSIDVVDSKHKTSLQTFFVSWTSIASSIPAVISVVVSTFYGHKLRTRSRLLITLVTVLCFFILFTGFIKINTDPWQTAFFALTMVVIILINATMSLFYASCMVLISRFPLIYTQLYLFGEGSPGLFSAVLQIISLAVGGSSETAALIYFMVGSFMIAFTLFLVYISKHFKLVQYYMDDTSETVKKPVYKLSELLGVLKLIWPSVAVCCFAFVTLYCTHPNVTSLVVSEDYGNGHIWADKYFVPVVTFLYSSIISTVGRIASMKFAIKPKISSKILWTLLSAVRMVVFIPLIFLCNALPRNHLPVVFGHDWQYIIISGVLAFTTGFVFNIFFMSITELAPGKEEVAYLSMMIILTMFGTISSPLGILCIKIL